MYETYITVNAVITRKSSLNIISFWSNAVPRRILVFASRGVAPLETEGAKVHVRAARIVWYIQRSWKDLIRFRKRIHAAIGERYFQNIGNDNVRNIAKPRKIVGMHMHDGIGIRQFLEDTGKEPPPLNIRKALKIMKLTNNLRKPAQHFRWRRIEDCPLMHSISILSRMFGWAFCLSCRLTRDDRLSLSGPASVEIRFLAKIKRGLSVNRRIHSVVELINSHPSFSDIDVPRYILLDAE